MNTTALLSSALAAVAFVSTAAADINAGQPPVPNMPSRAWGNCDLMASNTVRAHFLGLKDIPVPTLDGQAQPASAQVAIFEVVENLAYRKYVRYGDGQLKQGARFTVAMDRTLPGQPASVVDAISKMKPGDEAAMKVDHLFLFGENENKSIRPCTRIALREANVTPPENQSTASQSTASQSAPDSLPTRVLPLVSREGAVSGHTMATSTETRVSIVPDGKGGMKQERIDIRRELLPGSNEVKTRMFINGVEVDPHTRQPLTPATAAPTTPAAPAPTSPQATPGNPGSPATQAAPSSGTARPGQTDDTVVEHTAPAAAAPAAPSTPVPPALSPEESF